MTNHPLEELDSQTPQDSSPSSTTPIRKRDMLRSFLRLPKSKEAKHKASSQSLNFQPPSQQSTRPTLLVSKASNHPHSDNSLATSPSDLSETPPHPTPQPSQITTTHPVIDIFPENISKPVGKTRLPRLQERIEDTAQLVYCNSLLLQGSLSSTIDGTEEHPDIDTIEDLQDSTLEKVELDWLEEMKKDPMEQDHLRWLVARMVEVFIADTTKDSPKIAEIVVLGPVLQKESFRKLLSSFINDFDNTRILDVNLLRGLIALMRCARSGFLVSDDLIKILSILRVRLQGTHQQSTEYSYHLTLAVSTVLDVMADHKVQDLDRVAEQEPLSGVLSGLKDSLDPHLMYQACYAFQALQYVPNNESALQEVLRNSAGVADSLIKISAVFKLDLASVLEGLGSLQKSVSDIIEVTGTVYEGVLSLMESGQGVLDSLKEGLGSGQKRPWYPAIKAAYVFVQAGQLKDLKQLILEAPCRRSPLFQWGICQLLGEIAIDPLWSDTTRQQTVSFLGHLYQEDPEWGQDESVKTWMLTIITKLSASSESLVSTVASALLQDLDQDNTSIQYPYSVLAILPISTSSSILAKVHSIPYVEYDLHKLILQRKDESKLAVYIPPMAKANLQVSDDDLFPLIDKVEEFLASDRQVMLILGDSGAGKTTFNNHFELVLLQSYIRGGRIPLFINLPSIERPDQDLIAKQLRIYNFSETQIQELKQHRQFILICDGYDESQLTTNLHVSNMFNRANQWNVKVVISCRSQYLGQDYRDRFAPQGGGHYSRSDLDLFQEAAITPFSKEQIQDYVEQYVPLEPRTWTTQDYMERLTNIPNLMDLVKNPFLLSLSLEALPKVTEGQLDLATIKITHVQLYDIFVDYWLDVNKRRLQRNTLSKDDRAALDDLLDAGFVSRGIKFSTRLASAIFEKQKGNPVVQYVQMEDRKSWKAEFFGRDPEIRLLRESIPLTRTGNLFRFLHRSMLEYFLSRAVFDPRSHGVSDDHSTQTDSHLEAALSLDRHGPLYERNLVAEPSVIQFLCERVRQHPSFEKQLLVVIEQSRTDPTAAKAAANAITILVRAGVRFNGANLRGIRIPGADISGGEFDCAQLQGADLTKVNIAGSWLRKVDLDGAQMDDIRFGELPNLRIGGAFTACAYSPDGLMLAIGRANGTLSVYDTTTWIERYQYSEDTRAQITYVAFSPNNQKLVIATNGGTLRLWDTPSSGSALIMEGHCGEIVTLAFSPCGKQIASGSADNTVRLWSVETGETLFVLEGDTRPGARVAYTPDGQRLVSASVDGTIHVWDPEIGKAVASWNLGFLCTSGLVLSPDGLWLASSHGGKIQIMNTLTGEPGPVLNVVDQVFGIAFSPNSKWIAGTNGGGTLQLWDISTGRLVSSLSTPNCKIQLYAFSPSCSQIASCHNDGYVRLRDVDTTLSILDSNGPNTPVGVVTYCPDGQHILCSSHGRGMQLLIYGKSTKDHRSSFVLSQDGQQTTTETSCPSIVEWNRKACEMEYRFLKINGVMLRWIYSPCGRWIAVTQDFSIQMWDTQEHEPRGNIFIPAPCANDISCMAFTPTGLFVFGTGSGSLYVYDPQSQDSDTPVKKMTSSMPIHSLDCSPDDKELAYGTAGGSVRLWNYHSDEPVIQMRGHRSRVFSVAYSPCGKWILSASQDKTIRIWGFRKGEVNSRSCLAVVGAGSDDIVSVSWNPVVHREFVTGCKDGSVRVWRMSSGDDGGDVSVQMLWANNVGLLGASDLTFTGAIGLSPIYKKLLVQRGAIDDSASSG